jgi:putative PIG3 family NAD(P)H quinone oxidoreductase
LAVRAIRILDQSTKDDAVPHLGLGQVPTPPLGPGEVLIAVSAAGVNRADLLQARGLYPPPPGASEVLGLEVAGVVAAVGAGVRDWLPGDEVCALLPGGGYAEFAAADAGCVLPVPAGVALGEAAALPEATCTVWSSFAAGGLAAGMTVLVHGGSGGIGTAAIQIGAALGADVLATAGGTRRAQRCVDLGARDAFDYRSGDFAPWVREATGGRGADVILDVVGARYLGANLGALADEGALVVIGLLGGARVEVDLGLVVGRRLRLVGTSLRSRTVAAKAGIVAAVRQTVWPWLEAKTVRPVVDRTLPMRDAALAHALLADHAAFGKVLLEWPGN